MAKNVAKFVFLGFYIARQICKLALSYIFHFTQILIENVIQEKIPNPSYSRRSPPSSFSNLKKTKKKRYI